MASTNPFLTLYSTVQTNLVGSTISMGFIPYVSTAGRQNYTSTLSTLTVSTITSLAMNTTAASLPLQISGVTYATVTSSGLQGIQTPVVLFSQGSGGSFLGTGYKTLWIRLVGGGGGGGPLYGGAPATSGNPAAVSGLGMTTMNAGGGGGGVNASVVPPTGGTATGGNVLNLVGQSSNAGASASGSHCPGGIGGSTPLGFGGAGGQYGSTSSNVGLAGINGGGGGGQGNNVNNYTGTGGAAGGYCESIVSNPSGTYTVTIGAAATGGTTSGPGGAGYCIAIGYY